MTMAGVGGRGEDDGMENTGHAVNVESAGTPAYWWASCSCGLSAPIHDSRDAADAEADAHLVEVAGGKMTA